MSVNPVNNYSGAYSSQNVTGKENTYKNEKDEAVSEKKNQDTFVKSSEYKPDTEKVYSMKTDLANNVSAFKKMVDALINNQSGMAKKAQGKITDINNLIKVDKTTQLEAQQAISEDGYWGVEQTATRLLDFAKALCGDDPSKIDALRNAFIEGFKAAEKVWGGKLPDISYQTYDRVMEGFKEWENSFKNTEV